MRTKEEQIRNRVGTEPEHVTGYNTAMKRENATGNDRRGGGIGRLAEALT
jgi:hypothetical protein